MPKLQSEEADTRSSITTLCERFLRKITGRICGYRVEELEDDFIRQCRYLDKLIDELAQGRKIDKILRSSQLNHL